MRNVPLQPDPVTEARVTAIIDHLALTLIYAYESVQAGRTAVQIQTEMTAMYREAMTQPMTLADTMRLMLVAVCRRAVEIAEG